LRQGLSVYIRTSQSSSLCLWSAGIIVMWHHTWQYFLGLKIFLVVLGFELMFHVCESGILVSQTLYHLSHASSHDFLKKINIAILVGMNCYLTMALVCIYLISNEHLFMFLLPICISFLQKCLFRCLAISKLGFFFIVEL
jgi:hypothetical protein